MMKYLALLFLATSALAAGPAPPHVVRVFAARVGHVSGGTGFVVEAPSGRYFTLTNAHVCLISTDGTMQAYSEYQNNAYEGLHIIRLGANVDLCALEAVPFVPPTRFGSEPHPLEQIAILGHPGLGPLVLTQGYIEDMAMGVFRGTAKVAPGNSGSPVVDRAGKLIGIVYRYDQGTQESFSISVSVIRAFLRGL